VNSSCASFDTHTHTRTYHPRHKTRYHNIHAVHHGHFTALFFALGPALASTLSTEFCHLHVLRYTACSMLNSFFGPTYLRVNTISITNCFLATTEEFTENSQSVLYYYQNVTKFHGNCIYHVCPGLYLRRFPRNSPSFNKVTWKSHVLNYQNRTQHSRDIGIFSTTALT
jgi:hypothetical protein